VFTSSVCGVDPGRVTVTVYAPGGTLSKRNRPAAAAGWSAGRTVRVSVVERSVTTTPSAPVSRSQSPGAVGSRSARATHVSPTASSRTRPWMVPSDGFSTASTPVRVEPAPAVSSTDTAWVSWPGAAKVTV